LRKLLDSSEQKFYIKNMPNATVGHLVFHIRPENLEFYKSLFVFCGWQPGYEQPGFIGLNSPGGTGLGVWFMGFAKPVENDYDGPGLNHIALHTQTLAEVDEAVAWLKTRGIAPMFDTPRHRPDFSEPGKTYYQVMFVSPDKIQFEIVYIGEI
jgi:hypothetical protein